jgi:hypothetical protein
MLSSAALAGLRSFSEMPYPRGLTPVANDTRPFGATNSDVLHGDTVFYIPYVSIATATDEVPFTGESRAALIVECPSGGWKSAPPRQ